MTVTLDSLTTSISTLTLNRPEKRNALNIQLLDEFLPALQKTESDPQKRILIVQGAGPVFCAGMDLLEASNPVTSQKTGEKIATILTALYRTLLDFFRNSLWLKKFR